MSGKNWGPKSGRVSSRVPYAPLIVIAKEAPKPKAAGEIRREYLLATQTLPADTIKGAELNEHKVVETWTERKARRARERAGIPEPKPNMDTSKKRKPLSRERRNKMRREARRRQRQIEATRFALTPKRRKRS